MTFAKLSYLALLAACADAPATEPTTPFEIRIATSGATLTAVREVGGAWRTLPQTSELVPVTVAGPYEVVHVCESADLAKLVVEAVLAGPGDPKTLGSCGQAELQRSYVRGDFRGWRLFAGGREVGLVSPETQLMLPRGSRLAFIEDDATPRMLVASTGEAGSALDVDFSKAVPLVARQLITTANPMNASVRVVSPSVTLPRPSDPYRVFDVDTDLERILEIPLLGTDGLECTLDGDGTIKTPEPPRGKSITTARFSLDGTPSVTWDADVTFDTRELAYRGWRITARPGYPDDGALGLDPSGIDGWDSAWIPTRGSDHPSLRVVRAISESWHATLTVTEP